MLRGRQLEHGDAEAVIIGGMVLDIHATPSIPANPGTTTPGKVSYPPKQTPTGEYIILSLLFAFLVVQLTFA